MDSYLVAHMFKVASCARTILIAANSPLAAQDLTPMEAAVGGYPVAGDVWLYEKELACQKALKTPGYYKSLNGAEIADAHRRGHFPCWSFIGSWEEANQVFAHKSDDVHIGAY
jgi:hypothetical protein